MSATIMAQRSDCAGQRSFSGTGAEQDGAGNEDGDSVQSSAKSPV
jgi:hypothetical protein